MKKKTIAVLLLCVSLLAGCGSTAKSQSTQAAPSAPVATSAPEAERNEAFYAGIWTVSSVKIDGSEYTVKEVEAMGDDSLSNIYFVLKEGGSVYLSQNGTGETGSWSVEDPDTVTIGVQTAIYDAENAILSINTKDENYLYLTRVSDSQDITDIPACEEASSEAASSEAAAESESASAAPEADKASADLDPEFKAMMDAYEEFFDEYVEFMKKYQSSSNPTAMMSQYLEMLTKYSETMSALDDVDTDELSDADLAYYIDVNARIQKKLLEAY